VQVHKAVQQDGCSGLWNLQSRPRVEKAARSIRNSIMYMTWGFASCLRRTAIADAVHSGTKEEIPRRRYPAFELHIRPEQARRESHLVHQRSTGMLQLLMTLTRARGEGGGGRGED